MQFLLSADEMKEVNELRSAVAKLTCRDVDQHLLALGHVCRAVTTTMSYPGDDPHGCVHDVVVPAYYCDGCPVDAVCPLSKEYSK